MQTHTSVPPGGLHTQGGVWTEPDAGNRTSFCFDLPTCPQMLMAAFWGWTPTFLLQSSSIWRQLLPPNILTKCLGWAAVVEGSISQSQHREGPKALPSFTGRSCFCAHRQPQQPPISFWGCLMADRPVSLL